MNNTKEKTCADLVQGKFDETVNEWEKARRFYSEWDEATEGEQCAMKAIDKNNGDYFHEYDDFYDYVNQTCLSWDYVAPFTFTDQRAGYYRLQLSYGGPSDEFRIYVDDAKNVQGVEYWYMDWFDGAYVNADNEDVITDVIEFFMMCERC
tara:strand:- start:3 stop:452 length:450 start_codon:yes stop_codon:yes gene_type:complete